MDKSIDSFGSGVDGDARNSGFMLPKNGGDTLTAIDYRPARGDLGFSSQEFASVNLPYRSPIKNGVVPASIRRQNGRLTLTLRPATIYENGEAVDFYPYGKIPRLLLIWLATEVKRTKSRKIELGDTLADFISRLGLNLGGMQYKQVLKQVRALFGCQMEMSWRTDVVVGDDVLTHEQAKRFVIAESESLWFSPREMREATSPLFGSHVILSEAFYESLLKFSFPVSLDKIAYLNKHTNSPLALDIALFLFSRLYKLEEPIFLPWRLLRLQFGSSAKSDKTFKQKFIPALNKVINSVYRAADVEILEQGIVLKPSLPAVATRELKEFYRDIDKELGE